MNGCMGLMPSFSRAEGPSSGFLVADGSFANPKCKLTGRSTLPAEAAPQLGFKIPQIPAIETKKALNRGAVGGLGGQ